MRILTDAAYYAAIAGAIRAKAGVSSTYTPSQMASAIEAIPSGVTPVLGPKSISTNGTYSASSDSLDGYDTVTVSVPNTYTAGDAGKVVANGALSAQTSRSVTANGTYDTTYNNQMSVNVANSYTASDEGKVVKNGTLSEQTSRSVTANGTYNTTYNDSVVVNVPEGGGGIVITDELLYATRMLQSIPASAAAGVDKVPANTFSHFGVLSHVSFPACSTIGEYAFAHCTALVSASLPSVTTVGSSAFYGCSALSTISLPEATEIGEYAFGCCDGLTTVDMSKLETVPMYAFASCSGLISINLPAASSFHSYAFMHCSALITASFENATYIGSYCFSKCESLMTVSLPKATVIGNSAFQDCAALVEASLPSLSVLQTRTFLWCYYLRTLVLSNISQISAYAMSGCQTLQSVYLIGSSIPKLASTTAFDSTPIYNYSSQLGGYGKIYVPSSMYASYRTASVWSYLSSRITSLTSEQLDEMRQGG